MKINNPFNDSKVKNKALSNSKEHKKSEVKALRDKNKIFDKSLTFEQYAKRARYFAYYYYGRGELIPKGKVIDHIFSIKDGFENEVPLSIISHPFNLRLVNMRENNSKAFKSYMTLDELYNGVVFND